MRLCYIALVILAITSANTVAQAPPALSAIPHTHAHNDYEHPHPLLDAMSFGFSSVEADIWLYEGDGCRLRVAHDEVADPTRLPILGALYVDPLVDAFLRHGNGGVYADGSPIHLLVDIKSAAVPTYACLHEVLAGFASEYPGLITTYLRIGHERWWVRYGAIDITISGNRPRSYMQFQPVRYAGFDGRARDIGKECPSDFIPLISDNWYELFGEFDWQGSGAMPLELRDALDEVVAAVHAADKQIRFWNLPHDGPNVWRPLLDAGVDYINTDDLSGLYRFMKRRVRRR